jgi:hypothetical protein
VRPVLGDVDVCVLVRGTWFPPVCGQGVLTSADCVWDDHDEGPDVAARVVCYARTGAGVCVLFAKAANYSRRAAKALVSRANPDASLCSRRQQPVLAHLREKACNTLAPIGQSANLAQTVSQESRDDDELDMFAGQAATPTFLMSGEKPAVLE